MTKNDFIYNFDLIRLNYAHSSIDHEDILRFNLPSCLQVERNISTEAVEHYRKFLKTIFPEMKTEFNLCDFLREDSLHFKKLEDYRKKWLIEWFVRALCLTQWYEHVLETKAYKNF